MKINFEKVINSVEELKEFGIDVVMHEEIIKTTSKENWYSGTIVEH